MSTVSSTTQSAQDILASLARTTSTTEQSEAQEMQTRFLKLLTTQLQNQDPLNPMENAELTSQLAQLSTVEGIEKLNTMMGKLLAAQESTEALQSAALVGRGVLVEGRGLVLTEAGAIGGFELDGPADEVVLTITDASGLEVARLELSGVEAGSHNYVWDGTASDGSQAAEGVYTVTVSATQGGVAVSSRALQFGAVTSVIRNASGSDLQVGDLGIFKIGDIKQIL
ncbi:flagellar hook assembly protein FlgD [Pseudothauera nasutitermitis]|uniref:Basal-body rod modification protein FlgD n=1 Tax=Pseudothauera nasutitermitis TaxID=2565930 RepID=A0A4S4B223_9RHOO|nr:flagellar hook assembly protein FlgD [Pseudothauera nasutitermitis]THF65727.1 flagellar hook assembly protein FlgD [Pseudothauera nasutitermitis]